MLEKPNSCPICFEKLNDVDTPIECGHWVHIKCIKKCQKAECPLCRRPLNIQLNSCKKKHSPPVYIVEIPNIPIRVSKSHIEVGNILDRMLRAEHLHMHEFFEYDVEFVRDIHNSSHIARVELNACYDALERAIRNESEIVEN